MKHLFKILFSIAFILGLSACGDSTTNSDPNLTPEANKAVAYVKSHLERGDKLVDYQVVNQEFPACLVEAPFKKYRDTLFKAGLDYQSCKTRGLQAGMEMAENKINEAGPQILATLDAVKEELGNKSFLIVLAHVKTKKSIDNEPQALLVAFDPQTMQPREWMQITTPIQNTVAMVIAAQNNSLTQFAMEQSHDTKILATKTDNPIFKFILDSKAI